MTLFKRSLLKRFKTKYAPDEVDVLALTIVLLIVTFYCLFGCISSYAAEETIEPTFTHLYVNSSYELEPRENIDGYYFQIIGGHTYTIDFDMSSNTEYLRCMYTSEAPASGVPIYEFHTLNQGINSYTFNAIDDGYLYFYFYAYNTNNTITINSITDITPNGYGDSVNSLVDNVGVNQIWNVFNDGISFVGVVVLVAFGIFLIVLAIRKISKGKSEF